MLACDLLQWTSQVRECSKRRRRVLAGRRGLRRQGWNNEVQGDEAHLRTLMAHGERVVGERAPCGRLQQGCGRGGERPANALD